MPWSRRYAIFGVCFLLLLIPLTVLAQSGVDLAPSNPLGLPGTTGGLPRGSDSLYLSSGMFKELFPLPSNLEVGYLHSFGNEISTGRLSIDYLAPVTLSGNSVVFGEAHSEIVNFWKTITGGAKDRVDLSFGGGYRRLVDNHTFVGFNVFFDATRLWDKWYKSGSIGLEFAALIAGQDAVDLNFNWYGDFLLSSTISNAFRDGPSNFDLQVGYSHQLYHGGPDLRLHATGYKFSVGDPVYGYNAGAELKTRDGLFSIKYETGHDRINSTYHTVGGFVNVGLQLENLATGESPFVMPEPIFKSPRNLRRLLTQKVKRNWHQPEAAVLVKGQHRGELIASRTFEGGFFYCNVLLNGWTFPFAEGPLTLAEAQEATRVVVTFTMSDNTCDQPFVFGLYHLGPPYLWWTDGSPTYPAGSAANGTHVFELTPGQFTDDPNRFFIGWESPPTVGSTFTLGNVRVDFYR